MWSVSRRRRPASTDRKGTQSSPCRKARTSTPRAAERGAKTGGGAKAKQRTRAASASSSLASSTASKQATPAPREWPVMTSSAPGRAPSALSTSPPAAAHTARAMRAMPACASPPQNGSEYATASCTTSESEAVPRSASTTAPPPALSTARKWRRQSQEPATSSEAVSRRSRSSVRMPVCVQMPARSAASTLSSSCSRVGGGSSPNSAISAAPYAAEANRMYLDASRSDAGERAAACGGVRRRRRGGR
mmetsp:Transcript_17534/g.57048  ORF Transcript_17534/g.57048 Transcript_17534/m.57048 type:complete len:248 (+) Transcript_17534:116-859(+)